MRRAYGFAIVELLIVIVVIAILAEISITAYSNFTVRAADTRVREGAAQFEKALYLWAAESSDPRPLGDSGATTSGVVNGNCSNGSGAGFVNSLPRNTHYGSRQDGDHSMMLYTCNSAGAGRYILYWSLQAPTSEETANLESIISSCSASVGPRDSYGMRAARIIQL